MKRLCLALALAVLLLLVAGVGTAAADPGEPEAIPELSRPADGPAQQEATDAAAPMPDLGSLEQANAATSSGTAGNANAAKQDADQDQGSSGTQVIGQSAKSEQDALALALTVQKGASNVNAPVSVLSEGDSGDVSQENTATSDATSGNLNLTGQDADQEQSGDDCKCKHGDGGTQVIGQSAKSEQDAAALAKTVQEKPSNTNVSIRVLSPGDSGSVTQANNASSTATAGNVNLTKQDADQEQSGDDCKCSDGGTQVIGQAADSEQKAAAAAATVQEKPSNRNISIRVLSDGDDGNVTQTNSASSNATAGNVNLTKQDADQEQAGSGFQFVGQTAENDQKATALAGTVQEKPSNTNISIRVLSPGDGGNVTQSNTASSNATAGNLNALKQDADQEQGGHDCKCGDGKQVIGQSAKSEQDATALATTFQLKPSNTNTSIRVLSKGDDGDVTQSNTATSNATAGNLNLTKQDADQKQGGGSGIQVIGQAAKNDQDAKALAATFQLGASNENAPTRVLSKGDGGDVTQSNTASSDATALNVNWLSQDAEQWQGGKSRHDDKGPYDEGRYDDDGRHDDKGDCCGGGIQVIGQHADSDQDAKAAALTVQAGIKRPCTCSHEPSFGNSNRPVLVGSKGDGGDVTQSNTATSDADAFNLNATKQSARQAQATPCKCWEAFGIQVIGQLADSDQDATAAAATFQIGASNTSAPVSAGKGGRDHKDGHRSDGPVRE
jgi:ribosomal protein L24